eukprot:1864154-Alexandrium_andersonii.AAC.1
MAPPAHSAGGSSRRDPGERQAPPGAQETPPSMFGGSQETAPNLEYLHCRVPKVQSAIPRTTRLCCNPPQSATRPVEHAESLHAFEPGTARAPERPQNWSPTLPRCAFCG